MPICRRSNSAVNGALTARATPDRPRGRARGLRGGGPSRAPNSPTRRPRNRRSRARGGRCLPVQLSARAVRGSVCRVGPTEGREQKGSAVTHWHWIDRRRHETVSSEKCIGTVRNGVDPCTVRTSPETSRHHAHHPQWSRRAGLCALTRSRKKTGVSIFPRPERISEHVGVLAPHVPLTSHPLNGAARRRAGQHRTTTPT